MKARRRVMGSANAMPRPLQQRPGATAEPIRGLLDGSEALGLGELAQRDGALEPGEMVEEEHAFQMIHLVLQAGGEKAFRFQRDQVTFAVEMLGPDARGRSTFSQMSGTERQPSSTVATSSEVHRILGLMNT